MGQVYQGGLSGEGLRIGIVVARFNPDFGDGLLASCTAALVKRGVLESDIRIVSVPGALEIPLALQALANTGKFDALVALGAVRAAMPVDLVIRLVDWKEHVEYDRLGIEEDQPIEHNLVSKAIENAQRRVEAHNFEIRKHLLEYDNVLCLFTYIASSPPSIQKSSLQLWRVR